MDPSLQVRSALKLSLPLLVPSQAWLQALVQALFQAAAADHRPPPPLQSLVETAKARLLEADLAAAGVLDAAAMAASLAFFPAGLTGAAAATGQPEARLPRDMVVQVLDVENLSQSRWQQVEELEAVERGEQKRGREIVRVAAAGENGEGEGGGGGGGGGGGAATTHRLVLQDCRGQTAYALELTRIYRIGVGRTSIGEKLLLRNGTVLARGVVLLEPSRVEFLGGKLEAAHKVWLDGRLGRLKGGIQT